MRHYARNRSRAERKQEPGDPCWYSYPVYPNEYGAPYNALSGEVRAAIADLAALKYEVLQKVGDAVGNTQAYQL